MTRDIIDINDFTILVEEANSDQPSVDSCFFDEQVIAVAFYGSGNVNLAVKYGDKQKSFDHTKGLALSFFADEQVEFVHTVSAERPLECIVIATATRNIKKLPNQEGELFSEMLHQLVYPKDHYVEGPSFLMTPEMQAIVDQVFRIEYEGKAKMMFFRSQMTTLLAHFFGQLSQMTEERIPSEERAKLQQARDILIENLETPPSLSELSRQIGLPVFKYLQNERLNKAHELISKDGLSIQEAAWDVGYESLSSFSNAFAKKFGFRPSAIKQ